MAHRTGIALTVVFTGMLSLSGLALTPPQGGSAGLFEAISIKESSGTRIPVQWQGARLLAGEIPLQTLLIAAYQVPFYQLTDLPDWVRTVRYEINAVATRAPAPSEQAVYLRALLEERFRIVARVEVQDRPIYALVMARPDRRLGPGLRPSDFDCREILAAQAAGKSASRECRVEILAASYVRDGIPLALLADTLSTRLQRPVVDRTGLTGFFDVELRFRPPNSVTQTDDRNEPDLVTALEEQLGLELESTRGPVEVTVFDRIERPTPN